MSHHIRIPMVNRVLLGQKITKVRILSYILEHPCSSEGCPIEIHYNVCLGMYYNERSLEGEEEWTFEKYGDPDDVITFHATNDRREAMEFLKGPMRAIVAQSHRAILAATPGATTETMQDFISDAEIEAERKKH